MFPKGRNDHSQGALKYLVLEGNVDAPDGWIELKDKSGLTPFDVLVLINPKEIQEYTVWLQESSSPLAVLIVFGNVLCNRIDFSLPTYTAENFRVALEMGAPLCHRVKGLPPLHEKQARNELIVLGLMSTRACPVEPTYDATNKSFIKYDTIAGMPEPKLLLNRLTNLQLLESNFFDKLYICSNCQSARLPAREVCQKCNSSNIKEDIIVHHYKCGYQGSKTDFREGRELICPKCNKTLRHFGVDYDTPGSLIICNSCSEISAEPKVSFICVDCEATTDGEIAQTETWYSYKLTKEGELAAIRGALPSDELKQLLSGTAGWHAPKEALLLLNFCQSIHIRYKRPFSVATISFDQDKILRKSGPKGLTKLYDIVLDIIVENVRTSDAVTILNEKIFMIFPETEEENLASFGTRIQQALQETVISFDAISFNILSDCEIQKTIQKLKIDD